MDGGTSEPAEVFQMSGAGSAESQRQRKCLLEERDWKKRLELGILVTVIVVVWGLFLLPIVFYYNTSSKDNSLKVGHYSAVWESLWHGATLYVMHLPIALVCMNLLLTLLCWIVQFSQIVKVPSL